MRLAQPSEQRKLNLISSRLMRLADIVVAIEIKKLDYLLGGFCTSTETG